MAGVEGCILPAHQAFGGLPTRTADQLNSRLHGVPEFVRDDSQIGALHDAPFAPRHSPGHELAGSRPSFVARLAPHLFPGQPFVANESSDTARTPCSSERRGNTVGVQSVHDSRNSGASRVEL